MFFLAQNPAARGNEGSGGLLDDPPRPYRHRMNDRRHPSAPADLPASLEDDDPSGFDDLVPVLYDELRRMARRQRAGESGDPTLHTTELVHEAYLRLAGADGLVGRGRAYVMGAAARAMRRVLIDAARRRSADKRGGPDRVRVTLGEDTASVDAYASELLDLDRALEGLGEESPRLARVVECRYFGGMTVEETADALDVSPRTVKGDWALARAWLYDELRGGGKG